jgi:16S rRNA (guanine1516-N2)-methyltransferase
MPINFIHPEAVPFPSSQKQLEDFAQKNGLDLTFEFKAGQFWLRSNREKETPIGIEIDRELDRHQFYFNKSSVQKELLARAVGIKSGWRPRVLDMTGGLLGDSLMMLAMGCEVITLERHPVVVFLIESALLNAQHEALSRLSFHALSAQEFFQRLPPVDVLYFDPMFEDFNPKASPKKEMRIFREVVGEDQDAKDIFMLACEQRIKRLVVKRPRLSAEITEGKPIKYIGKSTRYDVYLSQNHGPSDSNQIK